MNRNDLFNYKFLKIRINKFKEQYIEKFSAITNITPKLDGLPKAKNKSNYTIEEFLDSSNELIRLYNEEIKKEKEIFNQLQKMENEKYRTVLYLRYIVYATEQNSLEKTALDMNYNYNDVSRWNKEALKEFDKLDEEHKKTQDNTN